MKTIAYVYKLTHLPTLMWYIGSRSAKGCHPDDEYMGSRCKKKLGASELNEQQHKGEF